MLPGICYGIMVRLMSLYYNPAAFFSPACSACDLGDELEGTFSRFEVWYPKTGIRPDYSHQSHMRKVMAFCNHLGADQYVNVSIMNSFQRLKKFMT